MKLNNPIILPAIEDYFLKNQEMPKEYFADKYGVDAEQNALDMIRYLIEGIFRWTPLEAGDYLTKDILDRFRITPYLKNIELPPGTNTKKIEYYLHLIYPRYFKFNKKEHYLNVYKDVLTNKTAFPKNFFEGYVSRERARICLQHLIKNHIFVNSISELYAFFGSPQINSVLKSYSLYKACYLLYNSPLDYLHDSLSREQKDRFLLEVNTFMYQNRTTFNKNDTYFDDAKDETIEEYEN